MKNINNVIDDNGAVRGVCGIANAHLWTLAAALAAVPNISAVMRRERAA